MLLVDTHIFAWITTGPQNLSDVARQAIEASDGVFLSTVSLYEVAQKVRLGKWPEMASRVADLPDEAAAININLVPLSAAISLHAGLLDWPHRDPFDRMIAATALMMDMPLVSADPAFDGVPGLRRVW